jgi:hypothetical protein
MTHRQSERPDDDELVLLLSEVRRVYRQGDPPDRHSHVQDPAAERDFSAQLWHGEVLADLADPGNDDRAVFAAVSHGHGLDTAAELRDLVRLTAAEAAAATLR